MNQEHTLYATAYAFYEQCNYVSSMQVFLKLATSSPFQEKYWKGLASSYQMLTQYREAAKAWAAAACLCPDDPIPHFHAAECLLSLKKWEDGMKALACARERLGEDMQLKNKIELLNAAAFTMKEQYEHHHAFN